MNLLTVGVGWYGCFEWLYRVAHNNTQGKAVPDFNCAWEKWLLSYLCSAGWNLVWECVHVPGLSERLNKSVCFSYCNEMICNFIEHDQACICSSVCEVSTITKETYVVLLLIWCNTIGTVNVFTSRRPWGHSDVLLPQRFDLSFWLVTDRINTRTFLTAK